MSEYTEEEVFEEVEETEKPAVANVDWMDPGLEDEPVDKIDEDQDADEFPPPPPDGIYKFSWDFAEADEKARWTDKRSKKNVRFLMTQIVGTIVAAKDETVPDALCINRKLRSFIMTLPNNNGGSTITDWLKSVMPVEDAKKLIRKANALPNKKAQFEFYQKAIEAAILDESMGWAAIQWNGSYKKGDGDSASYVRPDSLRGMKNWPLVEKERGGETVKVRLGVKEITDPDDGNIYEARAQAEIRMFIPNRAGKKEESAEEEE